MESYIVINGKKAELTEEQLKVLGIKKKTPFSRADEGHCYYRMTTEGKIELEEELLSHMDNNLYNVANYCTDRDLLQQQAYRETLNRMLWRYSMEHDGDKIDWECDEEKYNIYYDSELQKCRVADYMSWKTIGVVHFYTRETAANAIKEIVEPFMAEHPDFKW